MRGTSIIGREKEKNAFRSMLESSTHYWLLSIAGESGIGKSYLLKHLREFETPSDFSTVWIDFENIELRTNQLALLNVIGQALRNVMLCHAWETFKVTRLEELKAISRQMQSLSYHQNIVALEGGQITMVSQNIDEGRIIRAAVNSAREVILSALLDALESINNKKVIFFFDSFERLQLTNDRAYLDWIFDLLKLCHKYLSGNLRIVICGWKLVDIPSILDVMRPLRLHPFDEAEHNKLLLSNSIPETVSKAMYRITGGNPLLTDLVARICEEGTHNWERFNFSGFFERFNAEARREWLVTRIGERLQSPIKDLFKFAVILRSFDFAILQAIFPELMHNDENIFLKLIDYPFIKPLPCDFYSFHEIISQLQCNYLKKHMPDNFEQYHKRALKYYRKILASNDKNDFGEERKEHLSLNLKLDILYHLCAVDEREGLAYFHSLFNEALKCHDLSLCIAFIQEMESYKLCYQDTKNWVRYQKGLLSYLFDKWNEAQNTLLNLWKKKNISKELRAALSVLLAELFFEQSDLSRAVEYYQFGVEFYEKRQDLIKLAYLFANVGGKINRAIGRSSEAEKVLTRCLKILENEKHEKLGVARAKLQLGNLYRLYGRWDEALQKCQDSVRLYKEIGNDYCAGTALFTLGRIKMQKGDLHSAELTCQESIKLLKKMDTTYRHGMAVRNLGDILFLQGRISEAEEKYHECLIFFKKVGSDIESAIALGNLGNVCFFRGMFDEAVKYYKKSLNKKSGCNDYYGLAVTFYYFGNLRRNEKNWRSAIDNYQNALSILNSRQVVPPLKVKTVIGLANAYLAEGQFDKTYGLVQTAKTIVTEIELCKEFVELICLESTVLMNKGEQDAAVNLSATAMLLAINEDDPFIDILLIATVVRNLEKISAESETYGYTLGNKIISKCRKKMDSGSASIPMKLIDFWLNMKRHGKSELEEVEAKNFCTSFFCRPDLNPWSFLRASEAETLFKEVLEIFILTNDLLYVVESHKRLGKLKLLNDDCAGANIHLQEALRISISQEFAEIKNINFLLQDVYRRKFQASLSKGNHVHISSGSVVYRHSHDPEVLLLHRINGDTWHLPKGTIKTGESLKEAALRELQEETNVLGSRALIYLGELYSQFHANCEIIPKKTTYFLIEALSDELKCDSEHDEAIFVDLYHAEKLLSKTHIFEYETPILEKARSLIN